MGPITDNTQAFARVFNARPECLKVNAIFFLAFLVSTAQFGLADDDAIAFSGRFHENRNFITILAKGNGSTRKAHLTVYEVLNPNFQLRRLHTSFLVHQCGYTQCCLCSSGRFFVTINDAWWEELSHPLVIYDFVRNEHTTYSIDELFTKDHLSIVRKTMGEEDRVGTAGFSWAQTLRQAEQHFDPRSLTFSIHGIGPWQYDNSALLGWGDLPLQLGVEKPFVNVVIDLPTRIAKANAAAKTKDIREVERELASIFCVNQVSIEQAVYDGAKNRILLPQMIEINYLVKTLTYRLDAETQEYVIVEPNEWQPGEIVPLLCSADQDKELRKRQADAIEAAQKSDEIEKRNAKKPKEEE